VSAAILVPAFNVRSAVAVETAIAAGVVGVRAEATVARIAAQIAAETAAVDAGVLNAGPAVAAEATSRIAGTAAILADPAIHAGHN
jgi:NAD(P)-dependent dehydrogenase (short-subunit alcohol dehydrogenase family)